MQTIRKHIFAPVTLTLIYKPDLKILKLYLHTKMNSLDHGFQQLEQHMTTDTHTQTDRCRDRYSQTYYHAAYAGDDNKLSFQL